MAERLRGENEVAASPGTARIEANCDRSGQPHVSRGWFGVGRRGARRTEARMAPRCDASDELKRIQASSGGAGDSRTHDQPSRGSSLDEHASGGQGAGTDDARHRCGKVRAGALRGRRRRRSSRSSGVPIPARGRRSRPMVPTRRHPAVAILAPTAFSDTLGGPRREPICTGRKCANHGLPKPRAPSSAG